MQFWSNDDKVIEAGINILIFAAIFQVFDAATIIYNGSLRGAGDTVWLAVVSALGAVEGTAVRAAGEEAGTATNPVAGLAP